MPIVTLAANDPFIDGRQSDRALKVRLGVERYLAEAGWATLPEVTLKTGRRADLMALSPKGEIMIVEVKSSLADLKADSKWPEYADFCDIFTFATLPDVDPAAFPETQGLLIADEYGAAVAREGEMDMLKPHARKEVHLRFARASAMRLARCCAAAGVLPETFDD